MTYAVSNFQACTPPHRLSQDDAMAWLAKAYALTLKRPEEDLHKLILRFSAKSDQIETRYHFLSDFTHTDWDRMDIFNLTQRPEGRGLKTRTDYFHRVAIQVFEALYEDSLTPPEELIHVTCTGYASPSAAHHLVSKKNWGSDTTVTQLYHMGCFAAIPALRLASQKVRLQKTDIVHTELCSLYFNPILLTPEQIVVQSLFSDGIIKYAVLPAETTQGPSLRIETTREVIVPESLDGMTWVPTDQGFHMTLSREVPRLIQARIESFVSEWVGPSFDRTIFAIHPGGPKIIDMIAEQLGLKPWQAEHSRSILRRFGNMSSATLPYIWKAILEDGRVEPRTPVISLAFGPGLTICGSLMVKTC